MARRLNTSLSPGRRCLSWGSKSLNSEGKKAHVHMQSSMLLYTGKAIIEFLTRVHTQLSMLLYTGKAIIVSSFFSSIKFFTVQVDLLKFYFQVNRAKTTTQMNRPKKRKFRKVNKCFWRLQTNAAWHKFSMNSISGTCVNVYKSENSRVGVSSFFFRMLLLHVASR